MPQPYLCCVLWWPLFCYLQGQVQSHLVKIQPQFKADLLEKVVVFREASSNYMSDYSEVCISTDKHLKILFDEFFFSFFGFFVVTYAWCLRVSDWADGEWHYSSRGQWQTQYLPGDGLNEMRKRTAQRGATRLLTSNCGSGNCTILHFDWCTSNEKKISRNHETWQQWKQFRCN